MSVIVCPFAEQVAGADEEIATGRPELAVGVSEIDPTVIKTLLDPVTEMVWAETMLNERVTEGAASYVLSPSLNAVSVHNPARFKVSVVLLTSQIFGVPELKEIGSPEVEDATS